MMEIDVVSSVAVGLTLFTSLVLLLSEDWRSGVLALAGQYLGVFFLVWLSWPLETAVVKLVAGWMAGAVLGSTRLGLPSDLPGRVQFSFNRVFRLLAAGLVILIVVSSAPGVRAWVPGVELEQVWGSALLIGMGVLHLGLTQRPFRVILALLTVLSGFEILYASVENSTLVAGMLAGINLGLALVGSYLLVSPLGEKT